MGEIREGPQPQDPGYEDQARQPGVDHCLRPVPYLRRCDETPVALVAAENELPAFPGSAVLSFTDAAGQHGNAFFLREDPQKSGADRRSLRRKLPGAPHAVDLIAAGL